MLSDFSPAPGDGHRYSLAACPSVGRRLQANANHHYINPRNTAAPEAAQPPKHLAIPQIRLHIHRSQQLIHHFTYIAETERIIESYELLDGLGSQNRV